MEMEFRSCYLWYQGCQWVDHPGCVLYRDRDPTGDEGGVRLCVAEGESSDLQHLTVPPGIHV